MEKTEATDGHRSTQIFLKGTVHLLGGCRFFPASSDLWPSVFICGLNCFFTRSSPQRSRREQTKSSRDEGGSGLASVSKESKSALEECGREFAAKMLKEMGYDVEIMGTQNPGFDVRGIKPCHILKVEVKSQAREASVFMTQRECDEYLKTLGVSGETWELWNIENLAKASGNTPTIQRIGYIPASAMKESGYWVDLGQCSYEPPN